MALPVHAGERLDRLPVCRFHYRILALIGSGLFLDSLDLYVQGLVLAYLLSTHWSDVSGNAHFLSATFLGLVAGALISGPCSDRFGRRRMYQLNLLLFGLASIAGAFAPTLDLLIVCRFIMGLGLGGEVIICYGTLAEFTPPRERARWQGILALVSNAGIPASALLCAAVLPGFGWRPVFGLIGTLAILVWVPRRLIPESPRWYESQGLQAEAETTIASIEREVESCTGAPLPAFAAKFEIAGSRGLSLGSLFRGRLLRRTVLAIFLMVCVNTAVYTFVAWLPTILIRRGLDMSQTYRLTFLIQLGSLPGALVGGWAADRLGRRGSIVLLSLLAAIAALVFGVTKSAFGMIAWGFTLVVFVYSLVVIAFGIYVPEVFPTAVRMTGSSVANACGRMANVLAPQGVAWLLLHWGELSVYAALSALLFMQSIVVWVWGEDTERQSLEQIGAGEETLGGGGL